MVKASDGSAMCLGKSHLKKIIPSPQNREKGVFNCDALLNLAYTI